MRGMMEQVSIAGFFNRLLRAYGSLKLKVGSFLSLEATVSLNSDRK